MIGTTTLGGGATVSPGVARGTITMSGSLAFGGGGNYNWQIDDGSLPAGQPGSYDLASVLGGLAITASPNCDLGRGLRSREKNATEAAAGRFEKPAPDAQAAPPEAHESRISRQTVEEVPLTGLSFPAEPAEVHSAGSSRSVMFYGQAGLGA